MSLTSLPEEVMILIVKKLDLKSIHSLYMSSEHFKKILSLPGVIRQWHMTLNSMATVQSFKTDMFKSVACHLHEVNMCGAIDVCKTTLMPALRRLKNLKSLDVSYTEIDLQDFFDMYDACPTIKNICINFAFQETGLFKLPHNMIVRGQNIFAKMDNVHFVGTTTHLLYSNIVEGILQKANLNKLKYSIVSKRSYGPIDCEGKYGVVKFKQMYVYFMNLEVSYGSFRDMPFFSNFNLSKYEFIIITNGVYLDEIKVYVTPLFKDFFHERFGINAKGLEQFDNELTGNMGILIFNKEYCTNFDEKFFSKLYYRLKDCFPVYFPCDSTTPVPDNSYWFHTSPSVSQKPNDRAIDGVIQFKKKRLANPSFILDLDNVFARKTKVKLSLSFTVNYANPVALSPRCDFLPKLTFLSLTGTIRYNVDFFSILFRCCTNLETLDIVAPSVSACVSQVVRNLPLSKTLKNLRLIDRKVDYVNFFQSLSQCKTVENIHVLDRSSENTNLADPSNLFKNCVNLYSVCIKACMSNETKRKMTRIFNNAKCSLRKYQLHIKLCQTYLTHDSDVNYEPYIDVFNVYPIKPGLNL